MCTGQITRNRGLDRKVVQDLLHTLADAALRTKQCLIMNSVECRSMRPSSANGSIIRAVDSGKGDGGSQLSRSLVALVKRGGPIGNW